MTDIKVQKIGDYITFQLDRTYRNGALRCTHETSLYFNTKTRKWSGDEINSSGWVDLHEEDVMVLVNHYNLKSYIS